jgi:hypothetical protein
VLRAKVDIRRETADKASAEDLYYAAFLELIRMEHADPSERAEYGARANFYLQLAIAKDAK